MGTLQLQLKPINAGEIITQVLASNGAVLFEAGASAQDPVDKTLDLDSGTYFVVFKWDEGYQNIHNSTDGNNIIVNGQTQQYQVLGAPADANGVYARFTFEV